MAEFGLNDQIAFEQFCKQEIIEAMGLNWLIENVFYTHHPIHGKEAKVFLRAQPDAEGICREATLSMVIRADEKANQPTIESAKQHIELCKARIQELVTHAQVGIAFGTLVNLMESCPETATHEAIERGRVELQSGRLETPEAFLEFVASIV